MKAKNVIFILIVLMFSINGYFAFIIHKNNLNAAQKKRADFCFRLLNQLQTKFDVKPVLNEFSDNLFAQLSGKPINEASRLVKNWKDSLMAGKDSVQVKLYSNFKVINSSEDKKEEWNFFIRSLDRDLEDISRTIGKDHGRIVKLLKGGVGFEFMEGRPGKVYRLSRTPINTFGAWYKTQKPTKGNVDAVLILFHEKAFNQKYMAKWFIRNQFMQGRKFGFIDYFNPEMSVGLKGSNSVMKKIRKAFEELQLKVANREFWFEGKRYAFNSKPDGRIIFCEVPEVFLPIPFLYLALPFFWLPLLLKIYFKDNGEGLSIPWIVMLVGGLSVVMPAGVSTFYWVHFEETQRETAKIKWFKLLEQSLIQLDSSYNAHLREKLFSFHNLVKQLDGKIENLQTFIDKTVEMEIDGEFDTCLLINQEGKFLRPFSSSNYMTRSLVFYEESAKRRILDDYFNRGWVPFDLEAQYVYRTNYKNFDLHKFLSLSPPQGQKTMASLGKVAGNDLIGAYNRKHGFAKAQEKKDLSSMVLGSFMEQGDNNPILNMSHNLGDYVAFGLSDNKSLSFVDVIRDRSGKALLSTILYIPVLNLESVVLKKIFQKRDKWPESVSFFALSDKVFRFNFPYMDGWKRFERIFKLMKPPRKIHSEISRINGEENLIVAYAASQLSDYILIAAVPLKFAYKEIEGLKRSLIIGNLLFLVLILFFFWRISEGVICPSRAVLSGIFAMERKDHSHRIEIHTADEWEQLGEAFNSALEGMKELEVANIVQKHILPTDIIKNGSVSFYGNTIPADEVGGDYFDAFPRGEKELTFLMGDVSGHSVSAALVVSMAKAAFGALVDSGLYLPHEIFAEMNHLMLDHLRRVKMMTCFGGFVTEKGTLIYTNFGQSFPFLVLPDGHVESLKQVGYPLGAAKKRKVKFDELVLPDRCRLVMFSDGFVEAMNPEGEFFGYERLESLISSLAMDFTAKEFIEKIQESLRAYSKGVPWGDDVTMVVLDYDSKQN